MHRFSTTVEKERPQLNEETKRLIALCRRDPTEENLAALRHQVAANYDAVVARKKAKLEELKRTARHQSKIDDAQTKGACGGIDFWGNCWEWTSTARGKGKNAVKGGHLIRSARHELLQQALQWMLHPASAVEFPHAKCAKPHVSLKYGQMAAKVPSFIRKPLGIVPSCAKPRRS